MKKVFGIFIVLFFLGTLFWTKKNDSFHRKWFTLEIKKSESLKCVEVIRKPLRRMPVVVYAHGSGGNLMGNGNELCLLAEPGIAAINFEYDQSDQNSFPAEMLALLEYIHHQEWADTNAIAWVGISLGANRMLDFLVQHPEKRPKLLVQISGSSLIDYQSDIVLKSLQCQILLIHAFQDEIFPLDNTKQFFSLLHTNGVSVELRTVQGVSHGMGLDRRVVFRSVGEYCLTHLVSETALQNYHSSARWHHEALPLWLTWIPAFIWIIAWFAWWSVHRLHSAKRFGHQFAEVTIRVLATFLTIWASIETAIYWAPLFMKVGHKSVSSYGQYLVQENNRADFELLASESMWNGERLSVLIDHYELAIYNRDLINWKLDDILFRDYVLSTSISSNTNEKPNWRRTLWEEFYPYVRGESLPEEAARIVVRHLRERVTITKIFRPPHDVMSIWLWQITDERGFEIVYVATLRSVGIGARLNSSGQAVIWTGDKWINAPRPAVESFL